MKSRTVKSIVYAAPVDMGGMSVRQAFPSQKIEAPNPFLLLHHADLKVPEHVPVKQAGVGPHPHRGFSPVSFIFRGGVHHRDSRGNNNVVYAGGTQWMNAGMGIIHSERPPADIHEIGGRQELIQLWVNTPASHKMDQPAYFPLTREETPFLLSADGLSRINIQAGELEGVSGKIPTFSEINTYTVEMKKGGRHWFPVPKSHNSFLYLLSGKVNLASGDNIEKHYAAIFSLDGDGFELTAEEETVLFVGTGEPLGEPVVAHGPFVLNNETQVMEAFRDYRMGKMGVLIEE